MPSRRSHVSTPAVAPRPTHTAACNAGPFAVVVSCEHGGNRVPPRYREWFAGKEELLASHRGYDAGALAMARDLARALGAPLVASTTTRLLVDLNRSPRHRHLFSDWITAAPRGLKAEALALHYLPYRRRLEALVAAAVAAGRRVVHISSHSYTPILDTPVRNADVGILYDPRRPGEVALGARGIAALRADAPQLKVRRNDPDTGKSDGSCAALRRDYPAEKYIGIELEINQRHVAGDSAAWRAFRAHVVGALAHVLEAERRDTTPTRRNANGR